MSARALREYCAKQLAARHLGAPDRAVLVGPSALDGTSPSSFENLMAQHPWLTETQLVAKPDQLIKRRGKAGLLAVNKSYAEVQEWITERMNKTVDVEGVSGVLDHFLIEPFVPHEDTDEVYVCIFSERAGERVLFYHQGGVDIGDVDSKAANMAVDIDGTASAEEIRAALLGEVTDTARQDKLATFIAALLTFYRDLNFTYLEINPLVFTAEGDLVPLDMAAKLDETAHFLNHPQWGHVDFPAPFGRPEFPEEIYVRNLDAQTGASLKLTILNHHGRIWTMVAGGGASVIYSDTISDLGFGHELANYGEYSGAPTETLTYEYARTVLSLLTRTKDERGKVLIIGGGIANFTDVADTFKGIIRALKDYAEELRDNRVSIWVRRGGPNYQEGLRRMRDVGTELSLDMHVYGPETDIVAVVPLALGLADAAEYPEFDQQPDPTSAVARETEEAAADNKESGSSSNEQSSSSSSSSGRGGGGSSSGTSESKEDAALASSTGADGATHKVATFTGETRAIVFGLQTRAVQGMLDFDFMCKRSRPSVAAMVFPFSGNHYTKFYWGTNEVLIPVYQSVAKALERFEDVSVFINFASFRSVFSSTMDALDYPNFKTVAIIAEGVPESQTRKIIKKADEKGIGLIGPATVGGIKPGAFRIGNTGGMLDNIIMSKLYRPGSVAYVSKSGGMSNELNNIISRNSDGVYEGVAIGGDRYPGSRFIDHLLRYHDDPGVRILVLLGEVGGTDEYEVCEAIKSGRINKPMVAWCIGTCASIFPFEVQFGHAGALARGASETSAAKNAALREAGAVVPDSFAAFGSCIKQTFDRLVQDGTIVPRAEVAVPKVPMDYQWAHRLGLVRKPANFVSTISDDRGEELQYAGMPISEVFRENLGVGGVLSLLWFRRRLPDYATKFIEMVLMVTADHGPAVSGAHNTIVATRAGKDLVSSLVSGLLTIGPRFGGALDGAAELFTHALDEGMTPADFVHTMREKNKLIMGIGHRIKSLQNPDMRVTIVKEFAQQNFRSNSVLDFALGVEQITTKKKSNLILNVDGCIAVCFVDLLRSCGAFTIEEADELIRNGCLNGLFVLGRSIGFIGHHLDQKHLKQGLYRHPGDDISYLPAAGLGL